MGNTITIKINGILLKSILLVIPGLIILFLLFLQKVDYPTYCAVVSEDNVIEMLTAIFYLLSSLTALWIAVTFIRNKKTFYGISYLLLSFAMFFFFGEELSWGQRYTGAELTGFFAEHNLQNEINFHNLDYFRGFARWFYILTGFFGGFAWLITIPLKQRFKSILNPYYIPGWYLTGYFITVSIYYMYLSFIMPTHGIENITWREQEPAEFLLSMGFMIFILLNKFRQIQDLGLPESRIFSVSSSRKVAAEERIVKHPN